MSVVVYLSNQIMQVVEGTPGKNKASVKKTYIGQTPEGSIINGMIMDQESFVSFIRQFWATNKLPDKDVNLVISTTKFVGKSLEVPEIKENKMIGFIERECKDIVREEDVFYGYVTLPGTDKKQKLVYAEAISREFIHDYVELFKEAGIHIKGIYSGESSIINMAAQTTAKKQKSFVWQIADNMTLTTILWAGGRFHYYNTSRCFHEQGSEGYAQDIARSVSQIIQFMQAHQMEERLESIMLLGAKKEDMPVYESAIREQGITIPVLQYKYDHNTISGKYMEAELFNPAVCGLLINGRNANFLSHYSGKKKTDVDTSGRNKVIALIAAVFVIMLVLTGIFVGVRYSKQAKLKKIVEYNESPQVIMDTLNYDTLSMRNNFLSRQFNSIETIQDNLITYPRGNEKVEEVIKRCAVGYADVQFESFTAEEGTITIRTMADNVENINQFIKRLMEEDTFCDVNYTGYSFDESQQKWNIHVTCILKQGAGL